MGEELRILIVDDNIDDRELCRRVLEKAMGEGLQIYEAATGEACQKIVDQHSPNCVLLDYSLPGRNGIEVLKRIRVKNPNLPVIILTGQGSETIAVQAMKYGAQDYIIKSNINAESLYHVIKIAIEHCQMKDHIDKQQEALSLFTRALAHDLKEPLRTIQSFISLTEEEPLSKEQKNYLRRVSLAARNMNKLIQTVRSYTELTADQPMSKSVCDMNVIVESAITNLDEQIKASGAKIAVSKLPSVVAHESHLVQLFQNLIVNSIAHSDRKPPLIKIDFKEDSDSYEFFVRDNGSGVEKKDLESIFEPFKKLSRRPHAGSGLGLAICKKIMEHHKGKIWSTSSKTSGMIIHITLPKIISEPTKPTSSGPKQLKTSNDSRSTTATSGEKKFANVLYVDDSIDDIYLTQILLLERGNLRFNFHSVFNGKEAIEFLSNPSNPNVHLILLDINMPTMDGFEFLRYINEKDELRKHPVIMCSTSDYAQDIKTAKELGAVDYIVKPISEESFVKTVKKVPGLRLEEGSTPVRELRTLDN